MVSMRKHELILTIRTEGRSLPEFRVEILLSPSKPKIVEYGHGELPYNAMVSAVITNVPSAEENEDKFELRLKDDHAEKNVFSKNHAGRLFRPANRENDEGLVDEVLEEFEIPLFSGGIGPECLVLKFRGNIICEIDVDVKASPRKNDLFFRMISEVLNRNPFLALATQDKPGPRSRVGLFDAVSKDPTGDDSVSSGLVRLALIQWVVSELEVPMAQICDAPKKRISSANVRMPIERCRHFKPKYLKSERFVGRKLTVRGGVRELSNDTLQNRVLKGFLSSRLRELKGIYKRLENDRLEAQSIRRGVRQKLKVIDAYREDVAIVMRRIGRWLSRDALSGVTALEGESVFRFPRSQFECSIGYARAYVVMARYEMICQFWRPGHGVKYVPRFTSRNNLTSGRRFHQNPYSYIYEAWCFLKLKDAFSRIGFDVAHQYYRKIVSGLQRTILLSQEVNDPVYAWNKELGLRLALFYRVRAYYKDAQGFFAPDGYKPLRKNSNDSNLYVDKDTGGISYTQNKREETTPDFVVLFLNEGSRLPLKGIYAIVLDAKTTDREVESDEQLVLKRLDYLSAIKILRFRLGENKNPVSPSQSWLVYPGVNSVRPRIEFNEVGLNADNECTWPPAGARRILAYNPGNTYRPQGNICLGPHMASEMKMEVLEDWASVMTQTAQAYFRWAPGNKLF